MTILFVGWHTELKGVDVLAEAIPRVLQSCPNARFVLIGGDPPNNRISLKEQLTKTLEKQIRLGQVRFRAFTDDRHDLAALYQASALCVVPSRFDADPARCRRMGEAGRKKVLEECEAAKIAIKNVATYQRCGLDVDQFSRCAYC
jgi:glycosyltransferase involved in cell wall biosynthesis